MSELLSLKSNVLDACKNLRLTGKFKMFDKGNMFTCAMVDNSYSEKAHAILGSHGKHFFVVDNLHRHLAFYILVYFVQKYFYRILQAPQCDKGL